MTLWASVLVAGAAGAVCRYLVDAAVSARTAGAYPWGTLVVNLTGSLLLGVVAGLVAGHGLPGPVGVVAGGSFCGAYTTFSTLACDSVRLAEEGAWRLALVNLATLLPGGAAAAVGWAVTV